MIGDTTPNLPVPQADSGEGGGGLASIIMIAVTVVVAVYTAGAAAFAMGAVQAAEGATAASLSFGGVMSAGASAMLGGTAVGGLTVTGATIGGLSAAVGAAAIGGIAGSLAGQLAGVAMGEQNGISLNQLALSGLSAGIGAGVGAQIAGEGIGAGALRAAVTNVARQGVGVVTGLQSSFSWTSVAASAAGGAVGGALNAGGANSISQSINNEIGGLLGRTVSGVLVGTASAATTSILRGGRIAIQQVATGAFGNALATSLVASAMPADPQYSAGSVMFGPAYRLPSLGPVRPSIFSIGAIPQTIATDDGGDGGGDTYSTTPDTDVLGDRIRELQQSPSWTRNGASVPAGVSLPPAAWGNSGQVIVPTPQVVASGVDASGRAWYQYDDGVSTHAVPNPVIEARELPPLPSGDAARASSGQAGVSWLGRLGQEFIGTGLGAAQFGASAVRFVNDQGWVLANGLTGGWLAEHNADALAAVLRNEAVGQVIYDAPGAVARFGLRLATGNVSLDEIGQRANSAWQSDRIDQLRAAGDYVGAQAIRTQNVLGIASFAVGGEGVVAAVTDVGASFARTATMGARLAGEEIAASRTMQLAGAKAEELMYRSGVGPSYVVAPDFTVAASMGSGNGAIGFAGENAAHSAYQYALLKADLLRQEVANPGNLMSGPVVLRDPVAGVTLAQERQIRQYASIANLSIDEGYMSSTGRVSTTGATRVEASAAAREERAVALAEGKPYVGVVGHGPDTSWTGRPVAPFWLDMDFSINSSLGRQAQDYPIGYKPTRFIYQKDLSWTGNGNW